MSLKEATKRRIRSQRIPYLSQKIEIWKQPLFEFLSKEKVMIGYTFLPVIILLTVIVYAPIAWAIIGSFHTISIYHPEWTFSGLFNYGAVVADARFRSSIVTGTIYAAASVALQVSAGVALALLLNREFRFNRLIRAIAFAPYLIPAALFMMVFLWMGNSQFGILNQMLVDAGLIDQYVPWFGSSSWAMPSVIVASSWIFTIFVTIMVLARLQSIPQDYYETAQMLGASAYQQFRDITLPNLLGVLFIVILLRSVWMFNKFAEIFILTRGGPRQATETAPIYIYQIAFGRGDLGLALAASAFLFGLLVVSAYIYFRVFEPSEAVRVE